MSITATATVYLNEADGSFLGFNRTAPARLRAAATFEQPIPTGARPQQTAISAALEHIFTELNEEPSAPWALTYRLAGNRSLSVGDVVVIGETAWAVASIGWNPIGGDELAAAIAHHN